MNDMPRSIRIGAYRHRPAARMIPGPDGILRPTLARRRFPFLGLVALIYAVSGPAVCALLSALLHRFGTDSLSPRRLAEVPLPPSPTFDNLLFGTGLPETVLTSLLTGLWLWRNLWRIRVPHVTGWTGIRESLRPLLTRGLLFGPVLGLIAIPIAAIGLYIRTAPVAQPGYVRPVFALIAAPVLSASAMLTGVIPAAALFIGALGGIVTAAAIAVLWQHFPEEPVL